MEKQTPDGLTRTSCKRRRDRAEAPARKASAHEAVNDHEDRPRSLISGFERSKSTFEDRVGEPDKLSAAIGHVVHAFSELSAQLDKHIAELLEADKQAAELVTRMMPYRSKVDALGALVRHHAANGQAFNTGNAPLPEVLGDLLSACDQAGEHKRRMLGEGWNGVAAYVRQDGTYRNVTREGVIVEVYDADHIQDVADFMCALAMDLDEFFL